MAFRTPLPSIVMTPAPGPTIESGPEIWICPEVRVMVPVNPDWKSTVSGPACALACAIASRRLPAPLSFRLVTVYVAGGVPGTSTVKLCVACAAAL